MLAVLEAYILNEYELQVDKAVMEPNPCCDAWQRDDLDSSLGSVIVM